MTLFHADQSLTAYVGDVREVLRSLPAESVHCVVTSPPYWGLRDYKVAGQLGLESTPEEYVANMVDVFREVRRVLRADGTVWLNLGDSYAGGATTGEKRPGSGRADGIVDDRAQRNRNGVGAVPGLKPKDLVGVPWRVAFALQQPYYAGTIKDERDRIWLAAMLDAEGCLFIHKRKAGQHNGQGYYRTNDNYGPGVEISNTSLAVIERIQALVGKGSISTSDAGDHGRKQTLYRWNLRTTESRDFVRELYPHLVAKQQQARILIGCPSSGERAQAAHAALMALHKTGISDVDFPAPASMFEPGWYLRSDVIWSKLNPMPESVTDRPTKAHEYLFLLSKSARYYYDSDAKQAAMAATGSSSTQRRMAGFNDRWDAKERAAWVEREARGAHAGGGDGGLRRNLRSVWTVATQPYPGAHFATFPQRLVEPCIKAGTSERGVCPECGAPWAPMTDVTYDEQGRTTNGPRSISNRGITAGFTQRLVRLTSITGWRRSCAHDAEPVPAVVLDPFGGSGTTSLVAERLGRRSIYIDLSAEYAQQAMERIAGGRRDGTGAALDMPLPPPVGALWSQEEIR